MSKNLPMFRLSRLREKQHKNAVSALSAALGAILPDGLPDAEAIPEKLVEFAFLELESVGLGSVAERAEKLGSYFSLSFLSYLLSQPNRLSYQVGDMTLVADTRRFDLVEVLMNLQVGMREERLRLVAPAVTLSDACYNYRWRGSIFSFALGVTQRSIRAQYVAWHPSPSFVPTSASGLSVIRVQHRVNSEDRGQT